MNSNQDELRGLLRREPVHPPIMGLVVIALAAAIAAQVVPEQLTKIGLMVFAACLGLMSLFSVMSRRKAEREEAESERQRNLLDNAVRDLISHDADPAILTDIEGEVRFANPTAEAHFSFEGQDHLSVVFSKFLANPEAVLFRLQSRAITLGGAKEDIVTRDGQYRLSVTQVGTEAHLWRLERTGEAAQRAVRPADALNLPMMTVGPSNAILYLNETFRKFLGYRPKALREIFETVPKSSGERHVIKGADGEREFIIALSNGPAGRRELFAIEAKADAPRFDVPAQLSGDWDAIEDLPVPLLKLSNDGEVLASNKEARQLLGQETTQGKRVGDLLDGLGRPVDEWLREAKQPGGGNSSQFLRGRGEKQETFVQVTLNRAGGAAGTHLIAVLSDVTELKTLEAQFVQSQKMQAIGQLAGGVAHDFNNLLTAISGHCDLMLLRHDQGDQDYGDLVQIHQNANRAASLVGQLLAFSRKQNLQPERIDLRETLSDLTHLLNRLVGEKVTLLLEHESQLAAIKADKRQLEQVLMNLVVNARDAMPQGGEIRVLTKNLTLDMPLERDRAVVPAGDYVLVKVVDEGHGIPADKLPKIFEPFYTTKRTGEGTGLGLSTVYGIVKQTGGFIFAQSEPTKGTEFHLYFPAYSMAVAESLPVVVERTEVSAIQGDGVVLLVEDEAPVRAFASRALRLRGYTVLEADCAEAALDLLSDADLNVDIFVTDVIMPGMDGPTWVRAALKDRPDTKVVFVSGYAEDAFGDESDLIPNSVFLPKPFSLSQLTATVQGQLH